MLCKKDTALYVNKVKQFPRAIITDTADHSIREAAVLHEDAAMIAAFHGKSMFCTLIHKIRKTMELTRI